MKRLLLLAAAFALACTSASAASITTRPWGVTAKGEVVDLFTLKGAGGLEAEITNFGAVIVKLMVPDRTGKPVDIMLGFDDFAAYQQRGGVHGAIIGRYVGRISRGGSFPLDGKIIQLQKSSPTALNVIHGGAAGFHRKLWTAAMRDGDEPSLALTLVSPDGDGGFPGTLTTTLVYTLTRDNALKLDITATSDRPAIANLAHHAYFALQGEGNGDIQNQTLQVFADRYLPQDENILITGQIASVTGTPLDFRKPKRIGDVLFSKFPQIAMRAGLDITMIVSGAPGTLRPAARLADPTTGIVLDVLTTQPAVQLYGDGIGDRTVIGKGGKTYRTYYAMSLETEGYLDAPNHPNFPQVTVTPDKPMHEVTLYKFSTSD